MKRIALILIVIGAISCKQTTETKLKTALSEIVKPQFEDEGEKIESFKIDSVEYDFISEQDVYRDRLQVYLDMFLSEVKMNEDVLDISVRAGDTSYIRKHYQRQSKEDAFIKEFEKRVNNADTVSKLYRVNYLLEVKTNKDSYRNRNTRYITSDFKEFEYKHLLPELNR